MKASAAFRWSGFEVRELRSGDQVLERARSRLPAAVVLEVDLPELSGYEVCWILRAELGPVLPIVFVSADRTEPRDRVAGLLVGADDYLAKPCDSGELVARVLRLLRRSASAVPPSEGLTRREFDVLRLLTEGCDHHEIATRLVISAKTVSSHLENIFKKLGVRSRAQAVAVAYRSGIVESPSVYADRRAGDAATLGERVQVRAAATRMTGPAIHR